MPKYIAVDLGGTQARAALTDENGAILAVKKTRSQPERGPEALLDTLTALIESLPDWQEAEAVGMGLPGVLDGEEATVTLAGNLPLLVGYPVRDELAKRLGKPVWLANDANVAALAEALRGAGQGKKSVYYVTISTGVGGGYVYDGLPVNGAMGYAGEIGNMLVRPPVPTDLPQNPSCLEPLVSGTGLTRQARELFGDEIEHAGDFFAKVEAKEPRALQLRDEMAENLAMGLSQIAHIVNPDVIVLGGGVMQSAEYFWEPLLENFSRFVYPGMKQTEIVQAELADPGIVGAAMLALAHAEKELEEK